MIQHIKIFCDKLLKDYDTDIDREKWLNQIL